MRRKIIIAAVSTGIALGAAVGVAQPAMAQSSGCPAGDGWNLAPTGIFIDELDNGNIADQNGDGLACFRVNKGQTDKNGGVGSFTWKDNTNPA
jgi:hypothetical protein